MIVFCFDIFIVLMKRICITGHRLQTDFLQYVADYQSKSCNSGDSRRPLVK